MASATPAHIEWANLGQGAPEVGPIPDAPLRPNTIPVPLDSLEYAPTTGVKVGRISTGVDVHCLTFDSQLCARQWRIYTMIPTDKTKRANILMKTSASSQVDERVSPDLQRSSAMYILYEWHPYFIVTADNYFLSELSST